MLTEASNKVDIVLKNFVRYSAAEVYMQHLDTHSLRCHLLSTALEQRVGNHNGLH